MKREQAQKITQNNTLPIYVQCSTNRTVLSALTLVRKFKRLFSLYTEMMIRHNIVVIEMQIPIYYI